MVEQLQKKLLDVHQELAEANDKIIAKQEFLIQKLQEQNEFLKGLIEKYLLDGKKISEL